MKKSTIITSVIVCLAAATIVGLHAFGGDSAQASSPQQQPASQSATDTIAQASSQLLEIYDVEGSQAKARLTIDGKEIFVTDVFIGQNGIGKQREGDRKTPAGTLHVGQAFGISPNPGAKLNYIDVTPSTFACGDRDYYNQIIDTAVVHHQCHGEDMHTYVPEYNYGMTTSYNSECVYKKGSAIFIHCKGDKPYTAGCIAFDQERMIQLLRLCDQSLIVHVGE